MRILGIDPGLDGGMVLLDGAHVVESSTTPTQSAANGKGSDYDMVEIVRLIWEWKVDHICLERAQPMPGQGVVSMFRIGLGYGMWQGMAAALQKPLSIVHPKTWQKAIFCDMAKDNTKAASAIVAKRLWPDVDWRRTTRCKGPHDGLTDAACIAEYGRRTIASSR